MIEWRRLVGSQDGLLVRKVRTEKIEMVILFIQPEPFLPDDAHSDG